MAQTIRRGAAVAGLALLAGCATYVEDRASLDFQSLPPIPAPVPQGLPTGAIYHGGAPGLFAVDRRASQVGDLLTVSLSERFQARKSQSASADKSDSISVDLPTPFERIVSDDSITSGVTQEFEGTGTAAQSNSFTGLVTVAVTRVHPNGNLEVLGQKKLTLNAGDEYVRVRGIVRPEDIGPANIVNSNRLANAEITYIGAGDVADTGKRGWFGRLFTSVSPL